MRREKGYVSYIEMILIRNTNLRKVKVVRVAATADAVDTFVRGNISKESPGMYVFRKLKENYSAESSPVRQKLKRKTRNNTRWERS